MAGERGAEVHGGAAAFSILVRVKDKRVVSKGAITKATADGLPTRHNFLGQCTKPPPFAPSSPAACRSLPCHLWVVERVAPPLQPQLREAAVEAQSPLQHPTHPGALWEVGSGVGAGGIR